jgi:uncharacterized protein YndB with AHSA1/START domain
MTFEPPRRRIALARRLAAPRAVVFRAWTEADVLRRWWGPAGFSNPVCEADAREGGLIRIVMRAPDGSTHPMRGAFRELAPPRRLALTLLAEDLRGDPLLECGIRLELSEAGGATQLRLDASGSGLSPAAPGMLAGMEDGWSQSLDRLAALLGETPCP